MRSGLHIGQAFTLNRSSEDLHPVDPKALALPARQPRSPASFSQRWELGSALVDHWPASAVGLPDGSRCPASSGDTIPNSEASGLEFRGGTGDLC
jgi:hypothetical protein